jgi:threonine dehydrogenase-like Zn-dependent dehydrogenase
MAKHDGATTFSARALWHEGPEKSILRDEIVSAGAEDVIVRALWSGISRGTERLVWRGRVPDSERERMRAPFQAGAFPFPVKYGYCAVGVVERGPAALAGRAVFCLHPHQDRFAVPAAAVAPLPDGLPPRRAILTANMETAVNAIWDGGAAPGDRIAVVGAGALGLLVASVAARIPATEVTVIDVAVGRRAAAEAVGARFAAPGDAPEGCDLAFHASATAAGLGAAMATLGAEGVLVELSWHGAGETPVALGGAFHSQRLKLVSSQVGRLPPARAPRWDHRRRLGAAMALLADDRLDALIDAEVAFDDLPARLPDLLGPAAGPIAAAVRYG